MAVVLIANRDSGVRTLLREYIECSGHRVVEAANRTDALRNLQTTSVDIAIIDLFLPEADGLFLIKHLRDRGKHLKVIAMGDRHDVDQLHLARLLGADGVLRKPVHHAELHRVFERYAPVERRQPQLKMQPTATN